VQLELRRIAPLRAANIVALLYALSMLIFAVPMFIIFSVIPGPSGADPQQQQFAFSSFRWLLLGYPVFGLVFGWFGGLIASYLYNLIAARLGGFRLEYLSAGTPPTLPTT